jgi:hypothetical protein
MKRGHCYGPSQAVSSQNERMEDRSDRLRLDCSAELLRSAHSSQSYILEFSSVEFSSVEISRIGVGYIGCRVIESGAKLDRERVGRSSDVSGNR